MLESEVERFQRIFDTAKRGIALRRAWQTLKSAVLAQQTNNKPSDASSCRIKYCQECGRDIRHEPAHVG